MFARLLAVAVIAVGILAIAPPAPVVAATPIVDLEFATAPDGRFLPVIRVSINGSPELRMLADTGSNILVTFPGALAGVTTPVDNTGLAHTANYTGTQAIGTIAGGTVTVNTSAGPISTAAPVWFLDATSCDPDCLGDAIDAHLDGIFGLSQGQLTVTDASGPTDYPLFSPLAQLPGSSGEGYTVRLGETDGKLDLGRPVVASGDTVLQQLLLGGTYPTGLPRYFKRVPMCFQVGGVDSCLDTTVDSGEFTASLMGAQFVASPDITLLAHPVHVPGVDITKEGSVNGGVGIGLSLSSGGPPYAQWLTGTQPHQMEYYSTTGQAFLNTGNGFFVGRSIGFDNTNGHVVIGASTLAPSSPAALAVAGVGSVAISWDEAFGPRPVTGYIITVVQGGVIVAQRTVGPDARSVTIGGLEPGATSVSVAAASRFAAGPPGSVVVTVAALPATGLLPGPWLLAAVALLVVGGCLSRRNATRAELTRR